MFFERREAQSFLHQSGNECGLFLLTGGEAEGEPEAVGGDGVGAWLARDPSGGFGGPVENDDGQRAFGSPHETPHLIHRTGGQQAAAVHDAER